MERVTTPEGVRQYHLFVDDRHVFTVEGAEDEWLGENLLTGEYGTADSLRECKEWAESEVASRAANG